jgi:hypothetical protein
MLRSAPLWWPEVLPIGGLRYPVPSAHNWLAKVPRLMDRNSPINATSAQIPEG